MPTPASVAFILPFPIEIPCLLKRVVTYFNAYTSSFEVVDCFLEETKFHFFYSSLKYLICFLF